MGVSVVRRHVDALRKESRERNQTVMGKQVAVGLGTSLVVCGVVASLALAMEVTRSEYQAAVEPICKASATDNKRILAGVRREVKEGKLRSAASRFAKAARALKKTHRELSAVPKPAEDAARLTRWLSYVKKEVNLLRRASRALRAGKPNKARTYVAKLTHNANLANSQIVIYDLKHCLFKPAQYT